MKTKVLILAGGLGTRLKPVVQELPKSLALVNNKPFLFYLLEYIYSQKITDEVVISVGYKAEMIKQQLGLRYKSLRINYCYETSPLGTGGAIKHCLLENNNFDNFLILNGDTIAKIKFHDFLEFHISGKSGITLASKLLHNFDRYGSLDLNPQGLVVKFNEKEPKKEGYINCGVYLITHNFYSQFLESQSLTSFSFEKEVLEKVGNIRAFISDFYFIDIGIPADYEKAQTEFVRFADV